MEACLAEHAGEYVRMIGVDSAAKRRVSDSIIQRPDDAAVAKTAATKASYSDSNSNGNGYSNSVASTSLSPEALKEVRSLLAAGYKISTEHADKRRFKSKSWQSFSPIASSREGDVISALEACLAEHAGEYVRMIGIDSAAKRRISETIIQRP